MKRSRRKNGRRVMPGQILVGRGRFRLVAAGALDRALEIVGDEQSSHTPHEFEAADVRGDPVRQLLAPGRLGVGIRRRAQHGDEDLGAADLAAAGVDDRHRVAGVVDEQLVAGAVDLAHRALQALREAVIEQAELAVAIRLAGMGLGVLFPQQLQGDALALEFLVQVGKVRRGMTLHRRRRVREQQRLEPRLVHVRRQRPAETGIAGALHVLGHRSLGHLGGGGDAFVAQTGLELET